MYYIANVNYTVYADCIEMNKQIRNDNHVPYSMVVTVVMLPPVLLKM